MIRRSRAGGAWLARLALIVIVAAVAGCSAGTPTAAPIETGSINAPASSAPVEQASPPASPVVGVLTAVQSTGLTQVTGFSLRLGDGRVLAFQIGVLENGAQFPPGHLAEHLATSTPIRVFFRIDGPNLVAYRLEDAS